MTGLERYSEAGRRRFTENVTVTEHGPSKATGVATNLFIPAELTVTAAPGATIHTGALDWVDPTLASGRSVTHPVTLKVAVAVGNPTKLGGVTEYDGYDPNPANNAAVSTITTQGK